MESLTWRNKINYKILLSTRNKIYFQKMNSTITKSKSSLLQRKKKKMKDGCLRNERKKSEHSSAAVKGFIHHQGPRNVGKLGWKMRVKGFEEK